MKVDPDLKSLMKAVRKVSKPLAKTVQTRVDVGDSRRMVVIESDGEPTNFRRNGA